MSQFHTTRLGAIVIVSRREGEQARPSKITETQKNRKPQKTIFQKSGKRKTEKKTKAVTILWMKRPIYAAQDDSMANPGRTGR